MKKQKLTPVPWHLGGVSDPLGPRPTTWVYGKVAPGMQSGPLVCGSVSLPDGDLIAAAPDLLAAAQTVLAGLDARIRHAKDSTPVFDGIAALHDAIAKATGSRRD